MADRTTNVGIVFNADLSPARKAFEDWMRELESRPVTVKVGATTGARRTSSSTFRDSGGEAFDRDVVPTTTGIQQPTHIAQVATARSYGTANAFTSISGVIGSPVPSASANSVYGRVNESLIAPGAASPAISRGVSVDNQVLRYLRYSTQAVRAGATPMDAAGYFQPGGAMAAQTELAQWSLQKARNAAATGAGAGLAQVLPQQGMTAGQAQVNQWRAFVANQVLNTNTPAAGPGPTRGPVLPGTLVTMNQTGAGGGSMLSNFLGGSSLRTTLGAAGTATYASLRLIDQIGTAYQNVTESQRFDTLSSNAQSDSQQARSTQFLARVTGAVSNGLRIDRLVGLFTGKKNYAFDDFSTPDETARTLKDEQLSEQRNADIRAGHDMDVQNASANRAIDAMGYRGVSATIARIRNAADVEVGTIDNQLHDTANQGRDVFLSGLRRQRATVIRGAAEQERQSRFDLWDSFDYQSRFIPGIQSRGAFRDYEGSMRDLDARQYQELGELGKQSQLLTPAERAFGSGVITRRYDAERQAMAAEAMTATDPSPELIAEVRAAAEGPRSSGDEFDMLLSLYWPDLQRACGVLFNMAGEADELIIAFLRSFESGRPFNDGDVAASRLTTLAEEAIERQRGTVDLIKRQLVDLHPLWHIRLLKGARRTSSKP